MAGDLRVVKTRRVIQNTLVELLGEKELSKITVSEICARAQINRKTFYRHYVSVSEAATELENKILNDFSSTWNGKTGSIFEIGAAIRNISAAIEQRREFFTRFMKHNPNLFGSGRIKAALCRMIAVALKNVGALRDEDTINAAAEFAVSGLLSLYAAWFDGGCAGDLSFLTEVAVKMVTQGLSAFVSEEKLSEMRL